MVAPSYHSRPKEARIGRAAVLGIVFGVLFTGWAYADIYLWRDSDGVIHFSNGDAPPGAELYLKEPEPPVVDQRVEEARRVQEQLRREEELKSQIDAANRKLDQALEKVDDLAEKADEASEQARQAAAMARAAVASAPTHVSPEPVRQERVIVYAAPYVHPYPKGYRKPYGKPRLPSYYKNDKSRYPYYQGRKVKDPSYPLRRQPSSFQKYFIQGPFGRSPKTYSRSPVGMR